MAYEQVRYEKIGRVARVTADRPQYRNAQSTVLLRELDAAFEEATRDEEVRVIILAGEGKDFSGGHDIGTPEQIEYARQHPRQGRSEAEKAFSYSWEHFLQMSLRWRDIPKPTIAQVHGWCIFGGWIIASSMDLICASEDARFLTNLLQYTRLPYDVGVRKAKEILFDNRPLTAHEARELGFVNQIFAREDLESGTLDFAERIAANGTFFLRLAKLTINQVEDAMGYHAATSAAHSNYQLSQVHNMLVEQQGGQPRREPGKRRLSAVEQLMRKGAERDGLDPEAGRE